MSSIIEVKCDDSDHLYWRKQGAGQWEAIADDPDNPIVYVSSTAVTVEFRKHNSSNEDVDYKACETCTVESVETSSGPSIVVSPENTEEVFFAQHASQGSQRWFGGYVKVSKDD